VHHRTLPDGRQDGVGGLRAAHRTGGDNGDQLAATEVALMHRLQLALDLTKRQPIVLPEQHDHGHETQAQPLLPQHRGG
jgi:hypothetical protein